MSLKAFHIFFMVCSILLGMALAFWQFQDYLGERNGTHLIYAAFSFLGGLGLSAYLFWFFQKMKRMSAS